VKVKNKNAARLASLTALGAGAVGLTAKDAHAGIVYTNFSPPTFVVGGSPASFSFHTAPIFPGGLGGFQLFTASKYVFNTSRFHFGVNATLQIILKGLDGLQFQSAPGPGFIWNTTAPGFTNKVLRSKRTFYSLNFTSKKYVPATNGKSSTTYRLVFKSSKFSGSNPIDRIGDFYMLFTFNPTGTQDLYGWLHLYGACGCGLDTVLVDMAYEDSGAFIETGASPEPATGIPTGLAALALGATGIRRWRKSRKQAA
jgi:hypothetical protein